MTWFAANGSSAPLLASTAPIPLAGEPLILVNPPPAMTRLPSGASTIVQTTPSSAVGAQGSREPLARENAASRVRDLLLALKKLPPAYTVVADTAMPRTCEAMEAAKLVSTAPVAVLNATMWLR